MSGYINLIGRVSFNESGKTITSMSGMILTGIDNSGLYAYHHIGSGLLPATTNVSGVLTYQHVASGVIEQIHDEWTQSYANSGDATGFTVPVMSGILPIPLGWICGSIQMPAISLCSKCKKTVSYSTDVISVAGASGFYERWCWECAGYDYGARDSSAHREHWIRESVPLDYHTPAQIMADWLEENGKDAAAAYMRSTLTSGG